MDREQVKNVAIQETAAVRPDFCPTDFNEEVSISDAGFDSMHRIELFSRLEARLSIGLNDEDLGYVVTFGDLVDLLHEHSPT